MHPKKVTLLSAVLLVLVGTVVLAEDKPVSVPTPLPIAEFDLADYAGNVVLVDFWASWCAPCRQSLPWLNTMQQEYGKRGLQVVMVNLDKDASKAAEMAAEIDGGVRQFVDPKGDLAKKYKLEGMPSSFLYDQTGEMIASHVGFLKADGAKREQEIQAALEEKTE